MLDWSDLLAGVALFLIFEGLAPFASPGRMKRTLAQLLNMPDAQLRIVGLASIGAGLGLLFLVRG